MLNEIIRININELNGDNSINLNKANILRHKILVRENDITRIVKSLNPKNEEISDSGRPFIEDIISLVVGDKTEDYADTLGYITLNKVKYKRLLASSGNVRNSKVIFITENLWNKANDILLCGIPVDADFDVLAKYNCYYALAATDSFPVKTFPNFVVINDCEIPVKENFDICEEIDKDKYEVYFNKEETIKQKVFDGAGLIDISLARIWAEELGLDYVPSAFQFRCMAGIKGNLYVVDIKKFAKKYQKKTIIDCFEDSQVHKVVDEDGNLLINVILTKSQFKFIKKYKSLSDWKNKFDTVEHGYKRTFNISKFADCISDIRPIRPLSYQPLQSLSLTGEEISKICSKTISTLSKVYNDVDSFLKYRGIINEDDEIKEDIPPHYKALAINKDLFYDDWIRQQMKDDIKKFESRCCKGQLLLENTYQTLLPDVFGLLQYAFGMEVTGCLGSGQIYNKYLVEQKQNKVALCRFPHIAREWVLSDVVNPDNEFLEHITEGFMVSCFDTSAMCMNSADFDNDHIMGVTNSTILSVVRRQKANTILFKPKEKSSDKKDGEERQKQSYKINDLKMIIKTDIAGMNTSIGEVVNEISKLWSMEQTVQVKKYIIIMSCVAAQVIDFAKSGLKAEVPEDIKQFLKNVKLPYFMRYVYPKKVTRQNRKNKVAQIKGSEEISEFMDSNSTINNICKHMEQAIENMDKKMDNGEFEWRNLVLDENRNIYNNTYKMVRNELISLKREHDLISKSRTFCKGHDDKVIDNGYRYKILYSYARYRLIDLCNDLDKLLDYVINIMHCDRKYTDKKYAADNKDKALLWNCFQDEILVRIKGEKNLLFDRSNLTKKVKVDGKKKAVSISEHLNEKLKNTKNLDKKVNLVIKTSEVINKEKKNITIDVCDFGTIKITKEEIQAMNKMSSVPERRLLFVLVQLDKMFKLHNTKVKIIYGRKNKLTPTHICTLANIDVRQYRQYMKNFKDRGLITFGDSNSELVVNISESINIKGEDILDEISNINDCKKYFKKIC